MNSLGGFSRFLRCRVLVKESAAAPKQGLARDFQHESRCAVQIGNPRNRAAARGSVIRNRAELPTHISAESRGSQKQPKINPRIFRGDDRAKFPNPRIRGGQHSTKVERATRAYVDTRFQRARSSRSMLEAAS